MVIRRRFRRFLVPLALYAASAAVVGYFLHHAHTGSRGFDARERLEAEAQDLANELAILKSERSDWERRLTLLRSDQIDQDLLEERGRIMLGRVHRNDLVIILGNEADKTDN